jgi:hypothetical protein
MIYKATLFSTLQVVRIVARLFDRNMFIMLVAIMAGIVIITFFIADIVNQSKIEILTEGHVVEIDDINSRNENFTDYFLQGSVTIDSGREVREVGNYYFDFALFWYSSALANITNASIDKCIENCWSAMGEYSTSYGKFGSSKPFFEEAKTYTDRYDTILDHYVEFAQAGQKITILRYNASNYLRQIAENLSLGNMENVSMLMDLFNETTGLYDDAVGEYEDRKDQIDDFIFFSEIREDEELPE